MTFDRRIIGALRECKNTEQVHGGACDMNNSSGMCKKCTYHGQKKRILEEIIIYHYTLRIMRNLLRKAIFLISLPFDLFDILIDIFVDSFITFHDFNRDLHIVERLFTASTNNKDKKQVSKKNKCMTSVRFNNDPLKGGE